MRIKLLEHTKLSNAVIGLRNCWDSYHRGGNYEEPTDNISIEDKKFLDRVINKNKHETGIEFLTYIFKIDGISISCQNQLVRHRLSSFLVRCISGDSMITTSSGLQKLSSIYKNQSDLKNLPKVRVYDFESKTFEYANISEVFYAGTKEAYILKTKNGKSITSSEDHHFLTKNGWKKLKELNVGDTILTNGKKIKKDQVISIEKIGTNEMYDIEVDHHSHNFIANGIVVHNSTRYCSPRDYVKTGNKEVDKIIEDSIEKVLSLKESNDVKKLALPTGTSTDVVMSINGRSLRNFLSLRTDKHAHFEIRDLAYKLFNTIPIEHRFLYSDYVYDSFK